MIFLDLPIDPVFSFRTVPLKFGVGVLSEIGYDLSTLNVKKGLIITDKQLVEKTKVIEQTKACLEEKGIEVDVWDHVEPEPSDTSIKDGISYAKGRKYDSIVGIGGGSAIDTAKIINLYTSFPADFYDYFSPPIGRGMNIPGPLKPLIAVPTTSGTGSETTGVAIVTFKDKKIKFGLSSKYLMPTLAVLDPQVTLSMPPSVTANTGMDALMHAIESYTAIPYKIRPKPESFESRPVYQGSNPISDGLAERAIQIIGDNLLLAYSNGNNLEARANMHLAASMAGLAFGNAGTHIPHALSYPIAGESMKKGSKIPHGLAVAITGPATLKVFAPFLKDRCAKIAYLLGETDFSTIYDGALKASDAVIKMMRALKMPNGIKELGFDASDVPNLAEKALIQQRLLALSPITVNKGLLEQILNASLQYW
ncbi:MAG: hydroxyacid-oxoacid transhydrogenase [Nitrososphaeria archaeon]